MYVAYLCHVAANHYSCAFKPFAICVWSYPPIFLHHFINLFLVKLIGCCHRSLFVTQIQFSWFAIFASVGPTTHSAYVNTVITVNNLHTSVNFDWKDSFSSQKLNHGTLLKSHLRAHSARCHFTNNSETTQRSDSKVRC